MENNLREVLLSLFDLSDVPLWCWATVVLGIGAYLVGHALYWNARDKSFSEEMRRREGI